MPLANRYRLCQLHCVTKVSHTVDTARARQVASRPLPLSLGVPLVTRRNAAPLQSLETAREKTYHCVTARGANYVVQAPSPSVAILKMAVLEERLESENVRKDDKDAYDLRREARKRNGSEARAELSACYTLLDARKYGAERPHWIYTLDLKINEVEDNTAIAK